VLACLIGYLGDFDLAEEAVAEAFAVAAQRWPSGGMPDNPGAWLVTTARNRAIDRLRRDRVLAAKLRLLAEQTTAEEHMAEPAIPDERLELVFMCCHPALGIEAQVALTLRAVAGLTTEEIARAFLVPAETMKRRLTARIPVLAQHPGRTPSPPRPPRRSQGRLPERARAGPNRPRAPLPRAPDRRNGNGTGNRTGNRHRNVAPRCRPSAGPA